MWFKRHGMMSLTFQSKISVTSAIIAASPTRGAHKRHSSLGSGAIYPIETDEFVVKPFRIPEYMPRAYGLDVGWNRTAAVWGAWDRETDVLYLYSEHYRGQAEPAVHASAIKARGHWIKGVIDPASNGRQQSDGEQLIKLYRGEGLHLDNADNAVEAGILMSTSVYRQAD